MHVHPNISQYLRQSYQLLQKLQVSGFLCRGPSVVGGTVTTFTQILSHYTIAVTKRCKKVVSLQLNWRMTPTTPNDDPKFGVAQHFTANVPASPASPIRRLIMAMLGEFVPTSSDFRFHLGLDALVVAVTHGSISMALQFTQLRKPFLEKKTTYGGFPKLEVYHGVTPNHPFTDGFSMINNHHMQPH